MIDLSAGVRSVLKGAVAELAEKRAELNDDIILNPVVDEGVRDTRYRCGRSAGMKDAIDFLDSLLRTGEEEDGEY